MIIKLNMGFADSNYPDFGSIDFDRKKENLHLLSTDIGKLNSVVTRANISAYGAEFYFQSGDIAIVDDTQQAFVYNSISDTWTEWDI